MIKYKKLISFGLLGIFMGIFSFFALIPAELVFGQGYNNGCFYDSNGTQLSCDPNYNPNATYPNYGNGPAPGFDNAPPGTDPNSPYYNPTSPNNSAYDFTDVNNNPADTGPGASIAPLDAGSGDGTQGSGAVNGQTNNTGSGTGAAVAKGVQSAAACISSAQAIRLIKEAVIRSSVATYTKVNVTATPSFSQTGEDGKVSFNAIAYCLINAIIQYIVQATLAWVNSGFDGNPAFVNDPAKFFKDIGQTVGTKTIKDIASDPNNPNGVAIARTLTSMINGPKGNGSLPTGGLSTFLNTESFTQQLTQAAGVFASKRDVAESMIHEAMTNPNGSMIPATTPGKTQTYVDSSGKTVTRTTNPKITAPSADEHAQVVDTNNMGRKRIAEAKDFDSVIQQLMQALINVAASLVFKALGA